MPGRGSRIDGTYNAAGRPGGELLAAELDRLAAEGGVVGLHAKIVYLTKSLAGQEAMVDAGIPLGNESTRNTVLKWLGDDHLAPGVGINHANARKVDQAYATRRRETMTGSLKRRLARGGGARIAVQPPDQSAVAAPHKRDLGGEMRIRILDDTWSGLVDLWSAGDDTQMQRSWEDICDDQLYPPDVFYVCGGITIAA